MNNPINRAEEKIVSYVRASLEKDAYKGTFYDNERGKYEGAFECFLDGIYDEAGEEIVETTPGYDELEQNFASVWAEIWDELDRDCQEEFHDYADLKRDYMRSQGYPA